MNFPQLVRHWRALNADLIEAFGESFGSMRLVRKRQKKGSSVLHELANKKKVSSRLRSGSLGRMIGF